MASQISNAFCNLCCRLILQKCWICLSAKLFWWSVLLISKIVSQYIFNFPNFCQIFWRVSTAGIFPLPYSANGCQNIKIGNAKKPSNVHIMFMLFIDFFNIQMKKAEAKFKETLPKAKQTGGLSSVHQSNFFRSYHNFLQKSWSNIFRISTKHQLQNINQTSAFLQNFET